MGMTDYGADVLLEAILGITPIPPILYLALIGEDPEEADSGDDLDEPSDPAYVRQQVFTGGANWGESVSGISRYLNEVTFPAATQNWNEIYQWVLCTSLTLGEIVVWGSFDEGFEVLESQQVILPENSLSMQVTEEEDGVVI